MINKRCPKCKSDNPRILEFRCLSTHGRQSAHKFHAIPAKLKVVNPLKQAVTQARKDLKLLLDTNKPTAKPVADAALIERVRRGMVDFKCGNEGCQGYCDKWCELVVDICDLCDAMKKIDEKDDEFDSIEANENNATYRRGEI